MKIHLMEAGLFLSDGGTYGQSEMTNLTILQMCLKLFLLLMQKKFSTVGIKLSWILYCF